MKIFDEIRQGASPSLDDLLEAFPPERYDLLHQLRDTPQDPIWHAEGDVHVHTSMVLGELYEELSSYPVTGEERLQLVLSALFHDVAKPITTRTRFQQDGREQVIAPRHADRGRSWLSWRLLEEDLPYETLQSVLATVGHHHDPKFLVIKDKPSAEYDKLARLANLEHLYLLELADMRGRTCEDREEQIDFILMFRMFCEEYGVWKHPDPYEETRSRIEDGLPTADELTLRFVQQEAIRSLERQAIYHPDEELARSFQYREAFSHLVVTCGPSGSGKSTWLRDNYPSYQVVSMDELRREITGNPSDQTQNGKVLQLAKERLKESLRANKNVVWDATNTRKDFRRIPLGLGFDYAALTTLVVFHKPVKTLLRQNGERERQVPESVIHNQIASFEFPYEDEAHEVVYVREGS